MLLSPVPILVLINVACSHCDYSQTQKCLLHFTAWYASWNTSEIHVYCSIEWEVWPSFKGAGCYIFFRFLLQQPIGFSLITLIMWGYVELKGHSLPCRWTSFTYFWSIFGWGYCHKSILIFDVGFSYGISQELVSLSGALTIISFGSSIRPTYIRCVCLHKQTHVSTHI